ncbi:MULTISPECIES: MerR family transcriptional regulator [Streptomyces violaceoruber group]|uniref:MerR family transcriptional regulator n=1 Tax=Streptomyces rubrogriseus TaxID=194673 RepID=A0ABT4P5H9_9ACTN|nr:MULTISPECIES: MerR family transcriptional regulator [Streptomyces anthocyanicus group]MCW8118699.1 MerR family transcriptional regulator [Streptomyces anthocyanicus]MCZ4636316.1 MerR family transcriptional regulator [Streptomyces rubrogriseus]
MTHATDGSRRIGALARETGLSIRTLRYYDRLGLLTPSARTEGGHRCYDAGDVRRLHRVLALRSFGLPLARIRAVLDAEPDHDPAELIRRQLDVVEERLRQTAELRIRLLGVLGALDAAADGSTEALLDVIEEMTAVTRPLTPEQVAGLGEARRRWAESLGEEELRALHHRRAEIFATMGEDDRRRLTDRRRRALAQP